MNLIFKAHFAKEGSVFDRERLLGLAVAAGLDRDEADAVLDDPTAYARRGPAAGPARGA